MAVVVMMMMEWIGGVDASSGCQWCDSNAMELL